MRSLVTSVTGQQTGCDLGKRRPPRPLSWPGHTRCDQRERDVTLISRGLQGKVTRRLIGAELVFTYLPVMLCPTTGKHTVTGGRIPLLTGHDAHVTSVNWDIS
jgi:hypothetical protein